MQITPDTTGQTKIGTLTDSAYANSLKAAEDLYNVELKTQALWEKRSHQTLSMIGLNKDLSIDIMGLYKGILDNTDKIKLADKEINRLKTKLLTTVGQVNQDEIKKSMDSVNQQKAGLQSELDLLNLVKKSGWIPIILVLGEIWRLFRSMDKAAFDFRIKMGMIRDNVGEIRDMAQKVAVEFMHVGVTIEGVYNSIVAIGEQMGSIHIMTKDMVETVSLMKSQLGIAEEDSAGFMTNMASISGTTMKSQQNMEYMAAYMAQTAGIPLPAIMKDIAKMTGVTLSMISRIPTQIIRAAIEARRLNTTIGDVAKGGREILNFTESVNAEMEASVLIGKSVDLQYARQLAYRRDLVGYNNEILRLTKSIDFSNLDVFQQEAFARATGRSVEELTKMLNASNEWDAARRSSDPEVQARVAAIEKMRAANDKSLMTDAEKLRISMRTLANQTRMESITAKWNQLMARLAEPFLKILDAALSIVPAIIPLLPILAGVFGILQKILPSMVMIATKTTDITSAMAYLAKGIAVGGKSFSIFWRIAGGVLNVFKSLGKYIGPLMEIAGIGAKFASVLKIIPGIGWIITAVMFVAKLFSNWIDIFNDPNMNIGEKILAGLWAIPVAIWDTIVQPFIDAAKWVLDTIGWGGNSPSKIGNSIIKGIASSSGSIYDALVSPFNDANKDIGKRWAGNSPSPISNDILAGILSNKINMTNALTSPFNDAGKSIEGSAGDYASTIQSSMLNGMKSNEDLVFNSLITPWDRALTHNMGIIDKMNNANTKMNQSPTELNSTIESKSNGAYVSAVHVTPNKTTVAGFSDSKPIITEPAMKEASTKYTIDDLFNMLKLLNDNLTSGKVKSGNLYMDSNLVSTVMARELEWRGAFGTNR